MRKTTLIAALAVVGILELTACGTETAKTDPVTSPGTGAAKAGIGDTQTIGGLEITVKSVDRSLVVEWTEDSQVEGSPFFGVAVRWKNVGTTVLKDRPGWAASTANGTMNDGVAAEPTSGKQRGNLQSWPDLESYLRPATAREGWLTFEQKPGPLTKLYITVGSETAIWDLTKSK